MSFDAGRVPARCLALRRAGAKHELIRDPGTGGWMYYLQMDLNGESNNGHTAGAIEDAVRSRHEVLFVWKKH